MRNRLFAIIGPRRHDLSGIPFGFLFMWRPRDYPLVWQEPIQFDDVIVPGQWVRKSPMYAPIEYSWRFGFYFPFPRKPKIAQFESHCLQGRGPVTEPVRLALQGAVDRHMASMPSARIVRDCMLTGRRHDLSGDPLQVTRMIEVTA